MNFLQKSQIFYQLAALLNTGLTIPQSLKLAGQKYPPTVQQSLKQLSLAWENHQDLTTLSPPPQYFDRWTLYILQSGLLCGALPEVCQQLAKTAVRQHRVQKLSRSIGLMAGVTLWSLTLLIFTLLQPNNTFLTHPSFWGLNLLLLGGLSFGYSHLSLTTRPLSQLPLISKFVQATTVLDFTQLALPLRCGIPLLTALERLRPHLRDPQLATGLTLATRQISKGKTLSQTLQGKLPAPAWQMIRIGEETGHLDDALDKLATQYERELEQILTQVKSILLPVSIVAVGGLIGAISIRAFTEILDSLPT